MLMVLITAGILVASSYLWYSKIDNTFRDVQEVSTALEGQSEQLKRYVASFDRHRVK